MIADILSVCVTTDDIEKTRDFYVRHFGARVTFDCGWYVNLQFGRETAQLRLMAPEDSSRPVCDPAGLMLHFAVSDVDAEYARLRADGVEPAAPIEDHPWGDRGFTVLDPTGITVYIYSAREPVGEFRKYCR